MNRLLRPLGSLLDRIMCILAAVLLAQAPMYMNQYLDVLAGARLESIKLYEDLEQTAARYNQTVEGKLSG